MAVIRVKVSEDLLKQIEEKASDNERTPAGELLYSFKLVNGFYKKEETIIETTEPQCFPVYPAEKQEAKEEEIKEEEKTEIKTIDKDIEVKKKDGRGRPRKVVDTQQETPQYIPQAERVMPQAERVMPQAERVMRPATISLDSKKLVDGMLAKIEAEEEIKIKKANYKVFCDFINQSTNKELLVSINNLISSEEYDVADLRNMVLNRLKSIHTGVDVAEENQEGKDITYNEETGEIIEDTEEAEDQEDF